jgi:hypothetical protein
MNDDSNELETLPPDPVIEAYKQHVDRTLIRENLKLTVAERLQQLEEHLIFAVQLRRARRRRSGS